MISRVKSQVPSDVNRALLRVLQADLEASDLNASWSEVSYPTSLNKEAGQDTLASLGASCFNNASATHLHVPLADLDYDPVYAVLLTAVPRAEYWICLLHNLIYRKSVIVFTLHGGVYVPVWTDIRVESLLTGDRLTGDYVVAIKYDESSERLVAFFKHRAPALVSRALFEVMIQSCVNASYPGTIKQIEFDRGKVTATTQLLVGGIPLDFGDLAPIKQTDKTGALQNKVFGDILGGENRCLMMSTSWITDVYRELPVSALFRNRVANAASFPSHVKVSGNLEKAGVQSFTDKDIFQCLYMNNVKVSFS